MLGGAGGLAFQGHTFVKRAGTGENLNGTVFPDTTDHAAEAASLGLLDHLFRETVGGNVLGDFLDRLTADKMPLTSESFFLLNHKSVF